MSEGDPRALSTEVLPRALRVLLDSFEGGDPGVLKRLANRRLIAQLTRERVRAGKTQAEVAKAIDKPASDISRFERGDTDPRLSKLVCIADALGGHLAFVPGRHTSVAELVDLDEEWDMRGRVSAGSPPPDGHALCIILRGEISEDTRRIVKAVADGVVAAAKPLGGSLEVEAIFPLELGHTSWEPTPLERAVAEADPEAVQEQLAGTEILALGMPAGTVAQDGMAGTESDLLHFAVTEDGPEIFLLPVFTRPGFMREPLVRNPDWQSLSVLQINGGSLLANVHADVRIVINPWSELQFQLPSRDESKPALPFPDMADVAPDNESHVTVASGSFSMGSGRELVAVP